MSADDGGEAVKVQFNIDGLPLFKSSNAQFWPILAVITNCTVFGVLKACSEPFIVSLFLATVNL